MRLVRFSKILDFQPRFHNFGGKIGSLAAIPSPRTAGGCPPHARGGVRPPPEASPHARGGVPTPPEASPHARGGVGREQKCAPLPGSDVRLLRPCSRARDTFAWAGPMLKFCKNLAGPCPALGSTQFSGKQKGKQRVPSTLRFRKFPGKTEGVWCSIRFLSSFPRETREFP